MEANKYEKPKTNLHERKASSTSTIGDGGRRKEKRKEPVGTFIGFMILENLTNKPIEQDKINTFVSRFQNNTDTSKHLGIVGEVNKKRKSKKEKIITLF